MRILTHKHLWPHDDEDWAVQIIWVLKFALQFLYVCIEQELDVVASFERSVINFLVELPSVDSIKAGQQSFVLLTLDK